MVTDDDRRRDDPFGGFRVVTEPMGDGREIHYYEWPDEEADRAERQTPVTGAERGGDRDE